MESFHRSWLELSPEALRRNARAIRAHVSPSTRLIAVVKANAYGHGLLPVALTLTDLVDGFAVYDTEEALVLHERGITRPILLLGHPALSDALTIVENGFEVMLDDLVFAEALSKATTRHDKPALVHVKLDTGMSRRGVALAEAAPFFSRIAALPGITVEGICTHFANADDPETLESLRIQLHQFREGLTIARWCGITGAYRHAAASATTLRSPDTHFDAVRIGIALYGIAPHSGFTLPDGFTPALAWRTRIASIRALPVGAEIGYGLTETLLRNTRMALLPIGYADGYDRKLSSKSHVLVRGKRAKVLGRISMNLTSVDVTDVPNVSVGDAVTLLGNDGPERIPAEELAEDIGTIPYEVISRIPRAFPRIVK